MVGPSLGGVWVAHPDVSEPERVIIRNEGQSASSSSAHSFARNAICRGPKLQISSDAGSRPWHPCRSTCSAQRRPPLAPRRDGGKSQAKKYSKRPPGETVEPPPPRFPRPRLIPIAAAGAAIEAAPATPRLHAPATSPLRRAPTPAAPASGIQPRHWKNPSCKSVSSASKPMPNASPNRCAARGS